MNPLRRVTQPLPLALLTVAGLIATLLCEGIGKLPGLLAAALPLPTILFHLVRSANPTARQARRLHDKENDEETPD